MTSTMISVNIEMGHAGGITSTLRTVQEVSWSHDPRYTLAARQSISI
jgi:hypothetical protein